MWQVMTNLLERIVQVLELLKYPVTQQTREAIRKMYDDAAAASKAE